MLYLSVNAGIAEMLHGTQTIGEFHHKWKLYM